MSRSLQEFINSGEYFQEAKAWYKVKYIHPFSQRTFLMILGLVVSVIFASIILNIYNLFPTKKEISYVMTIDDATNKAAKIYEADFAPQDAQLSVVNKLVERYIIRRESYDYDDLKRQFIYVKNSSTRIVFRRFYNFMNIDNPESLILRYKKNIDRKIDIISAKHPDEDSAIVTFRAVAVDSMNKKYEDKIWQATLRFDVDQVDESLATGQRFDFTVTDYELLLLKDNLKDKI